MAVEDDIRARAAGLNLGPGLANQPRQPQPPLGLQQPQPQRRPEQQPELRHDRQLHELEAREEGQNEVDHLRQRIANLELELGRRPAQQHPREPQVNPDMVAEEVDIERARAAAQAARRDKPACTLPPIVPGFRVDPFGLGKYSSIYVHRCFSKGAHTLFERRGVCHDRGHRTSNIVVS